MTPITTLLLMPVIAFPPPAAVPGLEVPLTITQWTLAPIDVPQDHPETFTFTVDLAGVTRTVELHRHTLRSGDFQLLVDDGSGELTPVEPPPSVTYRGHVVDDPFSRVAASLLDDGLSAIILTDDETWTIEPAARLSPGADDDRYVIYKASDVAETGRYCGVGDDDYEAAHVIPGDGDGIAGGDSGDGGIAGVTPSWVAIAFDADYEFFQQNGSSVTNTVNDIEQVMNGVDTIFNNYVDIAYEITVIVVRSDVADPYTQTTMNDRLCQFRSTWNTPPESSISRGLAQLFTGYNFASGSALGVAWLGAACNQSGFVCGSGGNTAYSIVHSKYEFPFTTPLFLRTALSAHEIGHNWGAVHCDDLGPANCHIMCSGLGGCGGVAGANLKFDPSSINQMIAYKNQPGITCDPVVAAPLSIPFLDTFPVVTPDSSKWIHIKGALINANGVGEPSPSLSLNLDSAGSNPYQDDEIRSNKILLGGLAGSDVALTYATQHIGVEAGKTLTVYYFNSSGKWTVINTITSNGVDQTSYTTWEHILPANAKHNQFRIRFQTDGTDGTDDWYIDDVGVAIHVPPPPACPGDLNESSAVDGADLSILLGAWGTAGADLNDDGTTDGADLAIMLGAWGPCPS